MFKRIKHVLNNENGGPNVEQIVGIASASLIMWGTWVIGRTLVYYYYITPTVPTISKPDGSIELICVGYKVS